MLYKCLYGMRETPLIPIRIGERRQGTQRMSAHDRRPLGDPWGRPRRPESTPVARRRRLRHLRATKGYRGGRSTGSRDRLGTILGRFGVDLGGGEVPGTSAGPSRGALFANLTFFASEADLGSILPLPRSLWRALWPPLGALWAVLVALGTPLWAPKGVLGDAWGPSWSAFLRAPDGSGDVLGSDFEPIWARFWSALGWIFVWFFERIVVRTCIRKGGEFCD